MPVYLDYNATAPIRPEVSDLMRELAAEPMNASSVHGYGRKAKKWLEDARKTIAQHISAFPNEIIFTATGTEANVMALSGYPQRRVLISAVEHSSILKVANCQLPVASEGNLDLVRLEQELAQGVPALVSIQLANNETGILQPISEIAALCKKHGALLHTDAVQALGKIPVDFSLLGADMMTLSAHKMGGVVGAACLVVRQNLAIKPIFAGGQELGRRAGTENIPAIAAFAKAVELMDLGQMKELSQWMSKFESEIGQLGGQVVGKASPRLPNTSCIIMPGVSSEVQLMNADLAGFAVSAGSACSSGRVEPSHVLRAMYLDDKLAGCAIRVSAGWKTTRQELISYADYWQKTYCRLTKSSIPAGSANS
ncbi:MAG: cysteine desulfurase family protein [Alphaproteobacteria bacterium]|nr:cysteine desulfurase family protein [Alphaproteobacteria bacterium]